MSRTIGGVLGTRQLATLLGEASHHERLPEPPATRQLADARHATRQALAALKAINPADMQADAFGAVARTAALLRDVADELARIERAVQRGAA